VSWLDFLSNNPPPPNASLPGRESRGVSWPRDQPSGDSGVITKVSSSSSSIGVASPKRPSKRPRVDSGMGGEPDEDVDVGMEPPTSPRQHGAKGAKIEFEVEDRDTHTGIASIDIFLRRLFLQRTFSQLPTTNHLARSLRAIVLVINEVTILGTSDDVST
jgi:hypothetical protein